MPLKKLWVLLVTVFALSGFAQIQDRTIRGKVICEEENTALPGITIILKGTTSGTVTNANGEYQLNVPATGATLVFSFIGLKTQEITVDKQSIINVMMNYDAAQLSEVVVRTTCFQRESAPIPMNEKQRGKKLRRRSRQLSLQPKAGGPKSTSWDLQKMTNYECAATFLRFTRNPKSAAVKNMSKL